MKKIYLLVCSNLLLSTLTFSQWKSTEGPNGGNMGELVKIDNTLVVSAGNGGIYKSIDKGETWELQVSGLPHNEGVQDLIAINGLLYASLSRDGIYLSTDKAQNWTPINNGVSNLTFYNIMVHESEIYAGNANGGIYYSGDNGTTWVEKSNGDGVSDIQFQDFAYFKSAVYAGGSFLFKSVNSGDSWEKIEVTGFDPIDVSSMVATEDALYISSNGNVFVSSDDITWNKTTINTGATIVNMGVSGDSVYFTTSYGRFYYTKDEGLNWTLIQNKETSDFANDVILLNDRIIMSTSDGLYTSLDGGKEWAESNQGINALQIESIANKGSLIFAGTDRSGIFQYEEGENWNKINSGLDEGNSNTINDIIVLNDRVVIGTGGGVYLLADSGDEWIRMFDPGLNKSIQALDFDKGIFAAAVNGSGIYISYDTAKTFTLTETNGLNTETSYGSILVDGDTIVVSTHNSEIFLSLNLGQSWADISIVGDYYFTYDLHYADEKLYAATTKGLLFSEDLGTNWNFFINETKTVTSITTEGNKVYVSKSDGIYVTSNTREIWYDVSGELGKKWIKEIVLIGDKIYAGTFASSVWELPLLEANLPPIILSAESFTEEEDTPFSIPLDKLTVDDDNAFPGDFSITILSSENYSVDANIITPIENFYGMLTIPVFVNDGLDDSPVFNLSIEISPINDPPQIVEYTGTTTIYVNESLEISLSDFTATDVDNTISDDFTLTVLTGSNYTTSENIVTPNIDFVGDLIVPIKINDGTSDSELFNVSIKVAPVAPMFSLDNDYIEVEEDFENEIFINLSPDNTVEATYSLSPDTVDFCSISINPSTGHVNIQSIDNQFGEQVFTLTATDNNDNTNTSSQKFSVKISAVNDQPQVQQLTNEISIPENTSIEIMLDNLIVTDVDNIFPNDFTLTVLAGSNYTTSENIVTPNIDFIGDLIVPIKINDGTTDSELFNVSIKVTQVAPTFSLDNDYIEVGEDFENEIFINLSPDNTVEATYSLSPETVDFCSISINPFTGKVNIQSIDNQFGEQVFTLTATDNKDNTNTASQSFSVTVFAVNDQPQIQQLANEISIPENTSIEIMLDNLIVTDVDNTFPDDFTLKVLPGSNYSTSENIVTPNTDFVGDLIVPTKINDGTTDSELFNVSINVMAVLGIDQLSKKHPFLIFPNPSDSYLKINSKIVIEPHQVKIVNLNGKQILGPKEIRIENNIVDISTLPNGNYLLLVITEVSTTTWKFVKK